MQQNRIRRHQHKLRDVKIKLNIYRHTVNAHTYIVTSTYIYVICYWVLRTGIAFVQIVVVKKNDLHDLTLRKKFFSYVPD